MMGGNLFSATPNSQWAQAALNQIGFKAFMTTTLNRSSHVVGVESGEALVLPVSARDEEWQPTTIAATVPGMGALKDIGSTKQEFTIQNRLINQPQFDTDSGKARVLVTAPPQAVVSAQFPMVLASIRSEGQFNSIIYEEHDSYRSTDTRWSVLMNALDMADYPEANVLIRAQHDPRSKTPAFKSVAVAITAG